MEGMDPFTPPLYLFYDKLTWTIMTYTLQVHILATSVDVCFETFEQNWGL